MIGHRVLLTGAGGFVGERLLHSLFSSEKSICIISRKHHPTIKTFICDLEKDMIPNTALESVDTVFHLAGFAHDLRDTSKLEHTYHAINVVATVRLAELAALQGVRKFVFTSSVKAGGSSIVGRCVTEDNQGDQGVYGKTKREAELKILDIGRQSGMHISIVRPSLVYGPGVKGNLRLMRKGIEQGWFPPIPETGNHRSMIHVDDLVQALLLVAEDERANGEIFIATDGVSHSSREIYEAICHSVGKPVPDWSVPKFIFDWLSLVSPRIRYKVDKLLGDEYYTSKKLEKLGFRAERILKDWNDC
jgi:UDP-glucose 4-epimerase